MRPILSQKLAFFKTILKVQSAQSSFARGLSSAARAFPSQSAAAANGKLVVFALASGVAGTSLFYLMMTSQTKGSAGKFLGKSGGSLSRWVSLLNVHCGNCAYVVRTYRVKKKIFFAANLNTKSVS